MNKIKIFAVAILSLMSFQAFAETTKDMKVSDLSKGSWISFDGNNVVFDANSNVSKIEFSQLWEPSINDEESQYNKYQCEFQTTTSSNRGRVLNSGTVLKVLGSMYAPSVSRTIVYLEAKGSGARLFLMCEDSYHHQGSPDTFFDHSRVNPITVGELKTLFTSKGMSLLIQPSPSQSI